MAPFSNQEFRDAIAKCSFSLLVSQLLSRNKANCSLSAVDKENSIESPLDLLHYIYNYYYGYVSCLPQSLCPLADFFVTCYDHDLWLHVMWPVTWPFCDSVAVVWYFPILYPSNKEKKRKEKLNNNLAVLPSHDIPLPLVQTMSLGGTSNLSSTMMHV